MDILINIKHVYLYSPFMWFNTMLAPILYYLILRKIFHFKSLPEKLQKMDRNSRWAQFALHLPFIWMISALILTFGYYGYAYGLKLTHQTLTTNSFSLEAAQQLKYLGEMDAQSNLYFAVLLVIPTIIFYLVYRFKINQIRLKYPLS